MDIFVVLMLIFCDHHCIGRGSVPAMQQLVMGSTAAVHSTRFALPAASESMSATKAAKA